MKDIKPNAQDFEALLTVGSASVYTCEAFGDYAATYISPNVKAIVGYEPDEFVSDPAFWASHIHPDDTPGVFEGLAVLSEHDQHSHEYRFRHKDGRYIWMYDDLKLIRDAEGKPLKIVGQWHDVTQRKRLEEELRLYGTILENAAEGVNLIRASDGLIVYSNPKMEKMLGYDPGELENQSITVINAPGEKTPEQTANEIIQVLKKDKTWTGEVKNIRKDGTVIWCHYAVAVFDHPEYGEVWVGVGEDITKQKQAEEEIRELNQDLERRVEERTAELRESEMRLKDAERAALIGHWQFDAGTGELIRSDQDIRNYGLEPGQMAPTFEAFLQAVHPDDRDMVKARAEKAQSTRELDQFEFRTLWPDGQVRTILTKPQMALDDDGNLVRMLGVNQDITERKQAQSELIIAEERFRKAFHASPDMIFLSDIDTGQYRDVNDMFVKKVGYSRSELIGTSSLDLDVWMNLDDRNRLLDTIRKHGEVRGFESQFRAKSGAIVDYVSNVVTVELEGKTCLFSFLHDITEHKRLEKQLLRQERLVTLGQLTATVSHELRNPLGVIRTSAFIVRKGLNGEAPPIQRSLERIERSVIRCDRIIEELLDFTRIKEIEAKPTPIDAWLEETLREQTLPSGVALDLELGMPDMVVPFDHDRYRRAIINVFDNCCQAMIGEGQGDTVSEDQTLTVRTKEHDGRVEVSFEDTGPGIPPDVYGNIFEPLYSTKGFGVGLGLTVVKQIMEQHGGGIEIESEEGRGTRAVLWLPTSSSTHGLPAHGDP